MGSLMKEQVERFLREKKRHRRWLAIFLCLALLVSSGTFAMLRKNSQAMDGEGKVLKCEYQIHQHQDKCYDREGNLICGKADYAVHEHKENCYDKEGNLVCQIPERKAHVHDDSCYKEEKILVCGQEEATGHQHSQECYSRQQGQWICNLESHEHNENCYDGEGNLVCGMEAHQHGDQCYEWDEVLTCGQDETSDHIHGEECYQTEKVLTCGELETHEHKDSCYEDGVLTCTVPELKEHVHGEECFRDASGVKDLEPGSVSGNSDENGKTDEARKFSYEDERVEISVTAADKGIVPEDAELSVKPILQQDVEALREDESVSENAVAEAEELNAKYEEVQRELEASVAEGGTKELAGFLAYDISFLTEQVNEETGETEKVEIEPEGNVEVSMRFADAYIPEMPEMPEKAASEEEGTETFSGNDEIQAENFIVDVVHLKETPDDATGETKLDAEILDADIQTTDDAKVSEVTFSADSFSTFTISWFSSYGPFGGPVEVTFWDYSNSEELEPDPGNYNTSLNMESTNKMNIADITENGTLKKYYTLKKGEKTYYFSGARYVKSGESDDIKKPYPASDPVYEIYKDWTNPNYTYYTGSVGNGAGVPIESPGKIYFLYSLQEGEVIGAMETEGTLRNKDHNIKMYMHNINFEENINAALGGGWHRHNDLQDKNIGFETQGLVKKELGADGFPVNAASDESLQKWFSNINNPESERVDRLFLQKEYDKNKTFYYSSYANYAYLNRATRNFEVYKNAIGTIYQNGNSIPRCGSGGNFFPYNPIVPGKMSAITNRFDEGGLYNSPEADDQLLYQVQNDPDYHFGLYLETNFVQEKGGCSDFDGDGTAEPMTYEFTGDDDLWVFINGKLVLDIGGTHDAVKGTINFQTGEVTVGELRNGERISDTYLAKTSLAACLDPDDINGSTLKDYKTYNLKIFYLERNGINSGGGSALRMAFNLPTIGDGEVQVKKQLSNSNDQYANIPFNFKLMAAKESVGSTPENPQYDNDDTASYVPITANAVNDAKEPINFNPDGTFQLKPGETATFSGISKNRKFYVAENGFDSTLYESVSVNGTQCSVSPLNPTGTSGGTALSQAKTESELVDSGKRVVFTNNCSAKNSRAIRITKVLNGATGEDGPFKIQANLQKTDGTMEPYNGKYYLTKDSNGTTGYYKFNNDTVVPAVEKEELWTETGGISKIAPGYTVVIPDLAAETNFTVKEITDELNKEKYKEEYKIDLESGTCGAYTADNDSSSDGSSQNTQGIAKGSILAGKDAVITVTNYFAGATSPGYEWRIVKKSNSTSENKLVLAGAEFTLTGTENGNPSYTGTSLPNTGIVQWTLNEGTEATGGIPEGTYILEETKSPAGYQRNEVKWQITLTKDGITVNERNKDGTTGKKIDPDSTTTSTNDGKTMYEYTFLNTCIYELPSTGGEGIYRYLVSGIFLMMASALILYKNRRKGVVGK